MALMVRPIRLDLTTRSEGGRDSKANGTHEKARSMMQLQTCPTHGFIVHEFRHAVARRFVARWIYADSCRQTNDLRASYTPGPAAELIGAKVRTMTTDQS